jgi:hypothetical protein
MQPIEIKQESLKRAFVQICHLKSARQSAKNHFLLLWSACRTHEEALELATVIDDYVEISSYFISHKEEQLGIKLFAYATRASEFNLA